MSKTVIAVENLGKSYWVGHESAKGEPYTALRDVVGRKLANFGRKAWDMARGRQIIQGDEVEEFWALKDVSFSVKPGEVLGIIGRNGAGKSTLLKILSRITEPTAGRITLGGRIASLLEVGTGFHPELTGRENIFLNGAILGMTRTEIRRKFDEIVAFAEVEKFIDTPVKRYSSGMYVRLAFAIAAHLEPEVLIIDEVLAVGDLAFQRKCLGKMDDVAGQGRTILFVSHNMTLIRSLCTRGILLSEGKLLYDGPAKEAAVAYTEMFSQRSDVSQQAIGNRNSRTKGCVRIEKFEIRDSEGQVSWSHEPGDSLAIFLSCKVLADISNFGAYVAISSIDDGVLTSVKTRVSDALSAGDSIDFELILPDLCLRPGEYKLYIAIGSGNCEEFYDVIDSNIGMPNLVLTSDESDLHKLAGVFSIDWQLNVLNKVADQ